MPFQIIKSNCSCRQESTCELLLVHQFLPGMDCYLVHKLGKEIQNNIYINMKYSRAPNSSYSFCSWHPTSGIVLFLISDNIFLLAFNYSFGPDIWHKLCSWHPTQLCSRQLYTSVQGIHPIQLSFYFHNVMTLS